LVEAIIYQKACMSNQSHAELSHEDLQKVMSTIDIPVCPAYVTEAMAEAQKDEPDIKRLATAIANDAGMSASALKLANSPLFGSRQPVAGVRQAVERLGTKNVVCVVVASALRSSMANGLPAEWLESFWQRISFLALVCSTVARRQYGISPDAAYTFALFHDAAIPLMMKRFTTYGAMLDKCRAEGRLLVEAEAELFPCTHPIVGSLLVRNWGLPPMLGKAIRFHHEHDVYDLPDATLPGGALSLIAVTHVAEHLCSAAMGEADLEVGVDLFERALGHLGIGECELEELRQRVVDMVGECGLQ
jgi:HD-like signal output (HDOD) protein